METMVIITRPGCPRCKTLRSWLNGHDIPYQEESLYSFLLQPEKVKSLLKGIDRRGFCAIESASKMSEDEFVTALQNSPSSIRVPAILFPQGLPAKEAERKAILQVLDLSSCQKCPDSCPEYELCAGRKDSAVSAFCVRR